MKKQDMKRGDEREGGCQYSRAQRGSVRERLHFSPFAQLLQDVKDFLWLFGQTVLPQLLQLPARTTHTRVTLVKTAFKYRITSCSFLCSKEKMLQISASSTDRRLFFSQHDTQIQMFDRSRGDKNILHTQTDADARLQREYQN